VAKETFHGDAQAYGFMTAAMGIGAVFGGLYVAARGRTGVPVLVTSATGFGVVMLLAGLAPTLWAELIALALVGAASVGVMSKGNSTLQLAADPSMRGRVMSLWAVAFLGSTPIGGPIAGAVCEHFGGRAGLFLGSAACLAAAGLAALAMRRYGLHELDRAGPAAPEPAEKATGELPTT
jgi:MFS family permease